MYPRSAPGPVALLLVAILAPLASPGAAAPLADPAGTETALPGIDADVAQWYLLGFEHVLLGPQRLELLQTDLPLHFFDHLPVVAAWGTYDELAPLLSRPDLVSVTENEPIEWTGLPDAYSSNLGGTGDGLLNADKARALGYDGTGIGVAIVDSGVAGTHPDLRPRSLGGPLVQNTWMFAGPGGPVYGAPAGVPVPVYAEDQVNTDPTSGHGTHVAGIAVGRAPGMDLIACSVGEGLAILWAVACFEWILANHEEHDIRIVSNSFAGAGPYAPFHPVTLATKELERAGLLVFFAAGNAGPEPGTINKYAQAPWVVGVGSTSLAGDVSWFSGRGEAERGNGPDVLAPGHNIVSARNAPLSALEIALNTPYYDAAYVPAERLAFDRVQSGTSMATPQAAGVAALVLDANPSLSPKEVRHILNATARPVTGFGPADAGHGLLDAEAAVRMARGENVASPEWAPASEVHVDGDTFVYPFHGAMVGAPDSGSPFTQRMPVPVRDPAEAITLDVSWNPPVDTPGQATWSGLRLEAVAPDGTTVFASGLGGDGGPGQLEVAIDPTLVADHMAPGWSAGHLMAKVTLLAGVLEVDMEARVTYADGTLPTVATDVTPPPPPPPVELTVRRPITIASDDDFDAAHGVIAGSGTAADPYIIAGWDISGRPSTPPVTIGSALGTTAHVVLRDLYVHNSAGVCLELNNAQNVRIESIHVDLCDWGIYLRGGTSGTIIERSLIEGSKRGIGVYGAHDITIRDNDIRNIGSIGLAASQGGLGVRYLPSDAVLVEGNRFTDASIQLITPAATDWTIRGNEMLRSPIQFSGGTTGHTVSDMEWLGNGYPQYHYLVLIQPTPAWPAASIVDAGPPAVLHASGQGCFLPRVTALAPWVIDNVAWEFGDGTVIEGETDTCHTYTDPTFEGRARLTVTMSDPTGAERVLSDEVDVVGDA